MADELLRIRGVTKRFSAVRALDRVDFDLAPGEVHVLVGENGAGKSTLVKILAGSVTPDEGEIFLDGRALSLRSPHHARSLGISVVFQELSLVGHLSVVESLFLGREVTRLGVLRKREMLRRTRGALDRLGAEIDPYRKVRSLKPAERYLVEIAKATLDRFRVLILDEPTAFLTSREAEHLFNILDGMRRGGHGIIYITHRLEELERLGDRVTVLRDGLRVATLPIAETHQRRLIELMTGREYQDVFPSIAQPGNQPLLEVSDLSVTGRLQPVNFELRRGEILGVAGLMGCGKAELGRALFGVEPDAGGTVRLNGRARPVSRLSPSGLIRSGVMYFPADRHGEGLVLCRTITENLTLPSLSKFKRRGFLRKREEDGEVRSLMARLEIRAPGPRVRLNTLSGGNQQKVMLAKGLVAKMQVFVFDEPTRGIDVGAKVDVYAFIKQLAEAGAGVILISSDLIEVLNLSHRILVLCKGRMTALLPREEATEERVLRHYFGEHEAHVR